jgi:hypothetical protein
VSWLRSNGGKVSWIAFFALACHFIVTFGHVHIGHFGAASLVQMKLTDAGDHSHAGTAPTAPKKRLRHPPDLCAVCGSINLANALVLPASPGIILPGSFIQKAPWSLAAVAPTTYDHFPFYARGPPRLPFAS